MSDTNDAKRTYISLTNETKSNIDNFTSLNYNTNFNPKLCEVIDTFSAMIKYCQRELYSMFNDNEIRLMCNAFTNIIYTPNINPQTYFKDVINDNIMFENSTEEFKVDENFFNEKIEKLTSFQCYFLMQLITKYHSSSDNINEEDSFNRYFGFLIKKV